MKKWLLMVLLALFATGAAAAEFTQLLQRGSYKKILAAHQGQPLIVAMWSVSCTHCGADLEIFQKLAARHPQLKLVLISSDTPEQKALIEQSLNKYNLGPRNAKNLHGKVESWVFGDSFTDRLRFEIDPQWYGELPRTYFIEANGKIRGVSGVLDEQETAAWVQR